ncbi:hypothetical protein BDZ89DRAFT_1048543 [Hymenopellis radicata]|nr:hypothetical protein BDZ89DRAFT_1048543 [Hymenopellis radicata]
MAMDIMCLSRLPKRKAEHEARSARVDSNAEEETSGPRSVLKEPGAYAASTQEREESACEMRQKFDQAKKKDPSQKAVYKVSVFTKHKEPAKKRDLAPTWNM